MIRLPERAHLMGRRSTALLGALAIAMSGCGAATSPAPASPTATALPTAEPATPSPVVGANALCATDQQPCPIEAGTYTTDPFEPPFTFTVDDGWSSDRVFADGGQVSKGTGGFVWASGVTSGRVADDGADIEPGVDGFLAHLERFDGFDLSEPTDTTIGGEPAVQIDVTTNDVQARGLYFVKEDAMNLSPGEKARFFLLERDGTTVILILEAYAATDFDAFVAATQPLIASIAWE